MDKKISYKRSNIQLLGLFTAPFFCHGHNYFSYRLSNNTATTATFIPVLAAIAYGMGFHPLHLIVPAAISASCAFMLPVATPPNAIVFGAGYVTIPQMCKAGCG